jgi:S1-C subfamily serine protease
MRGRNHSFLFVSLLFVVTPPAHASCIDVTQIAPSTVGVMRHFDDAERVARPGVTGVRGTGWFLSSTTLVTAEHVTTAMKLSGHEWKPLEITGGHGSEFIAARIGRVAGTLTERLAVIELERPASDAQSMALRKEPLLPEEPVMTVAYPAGRSQLVSGRFVRFADDGRLTGMALLELYEGDDRLIIDHGASGAPVVDCNGRVAAVISDVFTQSLHWASHDIRISTAWGTPNVVSVPVQALDQMPHAGSVETRIDAASLPN